MVADINDIIERYNNGEGTIEELTPGVEFEPDDDAILAATENGRGDESHT
jgi:hypothetical protein